MLHWQYNLLVYSLGIFHILVSRIPEYYRWMIFATNFVTEILGRTIRCLNETGFASTHSYRWSPNDEKRSRMKYEPFVVTPAEGKGEKGEKGTACRGFPGNKSRRKKCLSTTQRFLVDLCSFRSDPIIPLFLPYLSLFFFFFFFSRLWSF